MGQSIAITGSGIICAIGNNRDEVLGSLRERRSGVGAIKHLQSSHTELPVGEVKLSNSELKALLGIDTEADISRTTLLGAVALRQAMQSAGLDAEMLKGKRVAFISGTTVGGMDVTERHFHDMLTDDAATEYISQHDCGSNTEQIASLCGLNAELTTISTACSSALNAIILGARMLLSGEADIVIAGGSEALSRFHLNGFNSLLILDNERCRPFDQSRRGLNLGEGAAYLVLERTTDALGHGAEPEAYIGGFGNRCDAFHQTATSDNGEGAYLAMMDALALSGHAVETVDYINAHGTGTPDNDRSESAAVRRLFGASLPPVSSTKMYTGHTTSASGSIEAVICLLAMANDFIPENLGWQGSTPDCIEPSHGKDGVKLHSVLCNSFGFGGNDSSLLLTDTPVELPVIVPAESHVAGECEVTDAETLKELKQYVSPMESRRMGKIMKAALLTTMRALEQADVQCPDAIVIGTRFGMLDQGEKILHHIDESGEEGLSPTLFMQSTHNTIAGTLAIRLKCHGYNITYSSGEDSFARAVSEAERLIAEGSAKTVLVGVHDECPDLFRSIIARSGAPEPAALYSKSMVIKANDNPTHSA